MTSPGIIQALMQAAQQPPQSAPPMPPGAAMQALPMQPPAPPPPQPIFQPGTGQFDLVNAIVQHNQELLQQEMAKDQMNHQNQMQIQAADQVHQDDLNEASREHEMQAKDSERLFQTGSKELDHAHKSEMSDQMMRMKRAQQGAM